jgi:hypothetical protein
MRALKPRLEPPTFFINKIKCPCSKKKKPAAPRQEKIECVHIAIIHLLDLVLQGM